MNYADKLETIAPDARKAVLLIANIEIDPEVRRRNFEILFKQLGDKIYSIIYDINAYDFEIPETIGAGQNASAYYNLSKVASDSVVTGNPEETWNIVYNWMENVVGKAQYDATRTAGSLGKYVVVRRTLRHSKSGACAWCESLAGTHTARYGEIDPVVFGRHRNCHCLIETEGFKSRNGTLNNYKKGSEYVG